MKLKMLMKGKKIAIIGFGKEGVSAANFLGVANQIIIYDDKPRSAIDPTFFKKIKIKNVGFYFDGSLPDLSFDYVIRSPGVRLDHSLIQKLTSQGSILTSPTKIFFDACPGKIIGVTGTKGKGTTATLIYQMLKTKYKSVFLAGNIGTPALDILPKVTKDSLVVLELSSFQLIDLARSPYIAVVLMTTSEHLDWHEDTQDYRQAKESIVKFQSPTDFAVINYDFEASKNFAQKTKARVYFVSTKTKTNGVYTINGSVISKIAGHEEVCQTKDVILPGRHNLQNVIAAVSVAKILQVRNQNIVKILKTFKGLPHRLQLVDKIDNVKFYNDSFSTTPETTIAAAEAFKSPKILILGGSSKKSDFSKLSQKINSDQTIKALILVGQEARRIRQSISQAGGFGGKIIEGCQNMSQIVRQAKKLAQSGDVVILSPACASFDMFKNYQDRGKQFIRQVKKLNPI